ncbi:NYN domain-containing protein [Nocardioides ferulae]|uniref:NYN domain-containing protein n=1 Tax=Nocardioides ferulae TaxID=2340821 RepID=UPI000EB2DCB4|nr:NYN domain-containing protein [Nocardioides ferulae]
MTETSEVAIGQLPASVRARVAALAAEVLPSVADLPASLRKVAAFAPARRARAGESAILSALRDPELRRRVGVQVGPEELSPDPVDRAARAWLVRGDGWRERLTEAVEASTARGAGAVDAEQVARLREKLGQAEQTIRDLRSAHREQVAEFKRENSSLRRKLGEARVAERAARAEVTDRVAADEEALARAEATVRSQDKELRRLRAEVARLEAQVEVARRTSRVERDEATLRARLLLDTVIDAASGLRRELALPSATGAPGDRVEAELAAAADGTDRGRPRTPSASPAIVEQHLALPRARLIVDGYNVSKSAWPASSLEAQRLRLVNGLAPLVARTGAETTVVFDAAAATSRPVVPAPRGVRVLFSPPGVIADDVIRDLVAAEPPGRVVMVVSDDQEVARHAAASGARVVSAAALQGLLTRSG